MGFEMVYQDLREQLLQKNSGALGMIEMASQTRIQLKVNLALRFRKDRRYTDS